MTGRFPWGAGRAPALRCDECNKRIGGRRLHCILDKTHLLCVRCMDHRHLHTKYYPDCPSAWHDMWDSHGSLQLATRAAAWFVLPDERERRDR